MENVRMTYLRPGNLYKDFIIESTEQVINSSGRAVIRHTGDGTKMLRGCLAKATAKDIENYSIKNHIVTHVIEQPGRPKARRTDRLILGERVFYICNLDDCGGLGLATLYYAEERDDLKCHQKEPETD